MFTIYSADVTGNPGNYSYPHKTIVLDEAVLKQQSAMTMYVLNIKTTTTMAITSSAVIAYL